MDKLNKVNFKFEKDLGNSKKGKTCELFASTAMALETQKYGKITSKIVSVKEIDENVFETKTEPVKAGAAKEE
jgi:hypothetical protein